MQHNSTKHSKTKKTAATEVAIIIVISKTLVPQSSAFVTDITKEHIPRTFVAFSKKYVTVVLPVLKSLPDSDVDDTEIPDSSISRNSKGTGHDILVTSEHELLEMESGQSGATNSVSAVTVTRNVE